MLYLSQRRVVWFALVQYDRLLLNLILVSYQTPWLQVYLGRLGVIIVEKAIPRSYSSETYASSTPVFTVLSSILDAPLLDTRVMPPSEYLSSISCRVCILPSTVHSPKLRRMNINAAAIGWIRRCRVRNGKMEERRTRTRIGEN